MEFHRLVPFATVQNFRDLGGYRTADGRQVRCRRLYRADGLFALGEEDLARFSSLGLSTVIDLRRPDELVSEGRLAEALVPVFRQVDFCVAPWRTWQLTAGEMPRYLADRYAEMADAGIAGANPVGQALSIIADARHAPLVFHCAAGKDRTGVLAALTLALLGVGDTEIADDYALSARPCARYDAWHEEAAARGLPPPGWALNPAPREAMVLFLEELRQRYGSVEGYAARAGIGAREVAALRDHLLA